MLAKRTLLAVSVASLLPGVGALDAGEPKTVFEWLATAPVIVVGENLEDKGKYSEFRVETVLRGEIPPATAIRVADRRANRDRDREVVKEKLKFEPGESYLLLLTPAPDGKSGAPPSFDLIRGARGARELPPEGRQAFLQSIERFVRIQDRKDELFTWSEMRRMLGETDPLLIETALDQFLKFGRGDTGLLGTVRPLLDHPDAAMRERTARLIGQILERRGSSPVPDRELLQTELAARARRDAAVPVRVAATEALSRLDGIGVDETLAEIAEDDPDQLVRYTAERLIYEREQANPGPGAGDGRDAPGAVAEGGSSN